jgi:hypothetical protein
MPVVRQTESIFFTRRQAVCSWGDLSSPRQARLPQTNRLDPDEIS